MNKEEATILRLQAHEIIHRFWHEGEREILELLSEQVETSLMDLDERESSKKARAMMKRRLKNHRGAK